MFLARVTGSISLVSSIAVLSIRCSRLPLGMAQSGDGVKRIPLPPPNQDFPISGAVIVPPGYETIYVSGTVPQAINPKASSAAEKYGDTKTQTISVMKQIQTMLEKQHLSMGDVVMMHVYLTGDPAKGGQMDFAGMMAGYTQFASAPRSSPTSPRVPQCRLRPWLSPV